jgi:hypothetical protein
MSAVVEVSSATLSASVTWSMPGVGLQGAQHRVLHRRDLAAVRVVKGGHGELVRAADQVAGFGVSTKVGSAAGSAVVSRSGRGGVGRAP